VPGPINKRMRGKSIIGFSRLAGELRRFTQDLWSVLCSRRSTLSRKRMLLRLRKHLHRHVVRIEGRGDAAVNGDLQQHFADLFPAATIGDCSAKMYAQFVRAVGRAHHGEYQQAAHFARQRFAAPDLAVRILVDELLQGGAELAGGRHTPLDNICAENLLANVHPGLMHFLIIHTRLLLDSAIVKLRLQHTSTMKRRGARWVSFRNPSYGREEYRCSVGWVEARSNYTHQSRTRRIAAMIPARSGRAAFSRGGL